MDGTISPFERLTEAAVAQRFEVSRTPVREALGRLLADGLLANRQGALFPYAPNRRELGDLYELRVVLERAGIERAITDPTVHHDREVLEPELHRWYGLRETGAEPDAGFVTEDEQFHTTLLRSAGNLELVSVLQLVNQRIRPVRMHDYLTADRMSATIAEHIGIAELVLSGKLPEALDALRVHVGDSQGVVVSRAGRMLRNTLTGENR